MKKNKGFTLIELLAVITLLSIILLIVVVSVSSVITNSKDSLHKTQTEQVLKAAEYYNSKEGNDNSVQCIAVTELAEKGYLKEDEIKDPKTGNKMTGSVLITYNGKKYSYEYKENGCLCVAKDSVVSTEPGTEYECEVKDGAKYKFYVLSEDDDKINLILNQNICGTENSTDSKNGTFPTESDSCTIAWYDAANNNTKGPVTVMTALYNATKDWINVPDINIDYEDEGNKYGKIFTTNDGIYITEKNVDLSVSNQEPTISYDLNKLLKARLVKYSEIYDKDVNNCSCQGSCPAWLIENLTYENVSARTCSNYEDKYSINNGNGITNISGYWMLSSLGSEVFRAQVVLNVGSTDTVNAYTSTSNSYGIRPVITVSQEFLSPKINN